MKYIFLAFIVLCSCAPQAYPVVDQMEQVSMEYRDCYEAKKQIVLVSIVFFGAVFIMYQNSEVWD